MVHKDAEKASAQAAQELNQLYSLSSASTFSLEEVSEATEGSGPKLFELDIRLREHIRSDLVQRVCKL